MRKTKNTVKRKLQGRRFRRRTILSKRQSPDVHLSTSFLSSLERLKEQCGSLKTDPHIQTCQNSKLE